MNLANTERPIFITGLPRSGTSMVAGLFDACGAWTGTTMPGDRSNPKGYYEHLMIRERVTKVILQKLGHGPLGVSSIPPLKMGLEVPELKKIMRAIINEDGYDGKNTWLYKDAKLSLLWPAFATAYPEARWIIVRRNSEAIIDSCLRAPFMSEHSAERGFWQDFVAAYTTRLELLQESVNDVVSLQSEDILDGEFSDIERVITQCGLHFNEKTVTDFICSEYWHSN